MLQIIFPMHFISFLLWKTSNIFCLCYFYCVGARITILMSISDGLDPHILRRKMERKRAVKEEMDREVFFPAPVDIFPFAGKMSKVLFPICTLIWRVNDYVSLQGKVYIRDLKVLFLSYKLYPSSIVLNLISNCLHLIEALFLIIRGDYHC